MPKLMTDNFINSTFFLPYSNDKKEGVWVKPLTQTMRNEMQRNALQESGHDQQIADDLFTLGVLKKCIVDWVGFKEADGTEIQYSVEALTGMFYLMPKFFKDMLFRVEMVASFGEVDNSKN